MSWIDGVRQRVRMLFRRASVERELADELEFHLEQEAARRRAAGMSPDAALRGARLALGVGQRVREEVREEWTPRLLQGVGADVRNAVRQLGRRPAFSAVAVLTLALGMGANTAIFSLVRTVLIEPLPYRDPARLVMVWRPAAPHEETWLSAREYVEYGRALTTFEGLGAYTDFAANLTEDGEPERVRAGAVTATLFGTFGATAALGRVFTEHEDVPGADGVVVVGDRLWRQRFGAEPSILGTTIRVNGRPRTVVGVMPPDFRLPMDYRVERPTELWVPLAIDPSQSLAWGNRSFHLVGRLRPGATPAQGSADVARITEEWRRLGYVGSVSEGFDRAAIPLGDLVLGEVRTALMILFGAVGLVLLIACANVAHLLLARSDTRRREIATRAALGASRRRIARQLLVEGALIGGLGATAGVAVGYAGLRAVLAFTPMHVIHARAGPSLDWAVLGFTAALAVVSTILAGLAPALQLSRVEVATAMGSVRSEAGSTRRGVRGALIAVETALAVVLVIGAVLLTRSFAALKAVDIGFEPDNVLTARIDLSGPESGDDAAVGGFYLDLLDRLRQLPGVRAAGATRIVPLSRQIGNWTITVDEPGLQTREKFGPDWQVVTPGYVEAIGLDVIEGRSLARTDGADAPLVALVSETMARRVWPGRSAVGRRFHLGTLDQPWIEVVGVVRDVRHNEVVEDGRLEMYLVHSQWSRAQGGGSPRAGMSLVVRTDGEPLALLAAVRREVRALSATVPISDVATLDRVVETALGRPRFVTALLGVFAGLSLLLATIGLYAMMSYTAARRTHEIGIRMALGAKPRAVARMVVSEGVVMTAAGLVVGIVLAAWATRFLAGELYLVGRLDPLTFGLVPVALLTVSAVASYLPARRAARVSPLVARKLLAVGAQWKNTFALGSGRHAFLSHHVGDLEDYRAYEAFERDIRLYEELFEFSPDVLVHDLHPDYASTRYARERSDREGLPRIGVQHHHAHVASCMAENGISGPVIGVAFDGTGFGTDGTLWGGEVLVADEAHFERAAHLLPVALPGGDRAAREPWRMAVSYVLASGLDPSGFVDEPGVERVVEMIRKNVNAPLTSSAGRLFDAVASLLGVRQKTTYEGQAAMELEWLCGDRASGAAYPYSLLENEDALVVDTRPLVRAVVEAKESREDVAEISRRFHQTVSSLIVDCCLRIRETEGLERVALSGGVFQNLLLTTSVVPALEERGFHVFRHRKVPPSDGGLALGQLAVAGGLLSCA